MKVVDGAPVFETKPCWCGDGLGHEYVTCEKCGGTGRGPRGGRGGCKQCHGDKKRLVKSKTVVCGRCDGTLVVPETRTDRIPVEVFKGLKIPVVVAGSTSRALTFNESYLGFGCLWSTVDYGATEKLTDEELIAQVESELYKGGHTQPQLCSIWKAEKGFASAIVIVRGRGGYSVRPQWGSEPVVPKGGSVETDLARGAKVFKAGGHGTLAAATETF